jgi:hypothetical protein
MTRFFPNPSIAGALPQGFVLDPASDECFVNLNDLD